VLTEVLKRISAPVFVFEAMVEKRYVDADYDTIADARAHRIIVEYLARKTTRDAQACLQPVLDVAMHAEKPIVFGRRSAREPATVSLTAEPAARGRPDASGIPCGRLNTTAPGIGTWAYSADCGATSQTEIE